MPRPELKEQILFFQLLSPQVEAAVKVEVQELEAQPVDLAVADLLITEPLELELSTKVLMAELLQVLVAEVAVALDRLVQAHPITQGVTVV
jgi:hypothetical protein